MGVDIATSLSVIFACFVFIVNQIKERKIASRQRQLERMSLEKAQRQKDFEQAFLFVSKGYVESYEKFVNLVSSANKAGSLMPTEDFHPGKLIANTFNEIILTAENLINFNINLIIPFLTKCNADGHLDISIKVNDELLAWNKKFIAAYNAGDPKGMGIYDEPVKIVGNSIVAMYTTKLS